MSDKESLSKSSSAVKISSFEVVESDEEVHVAERVADNDLERTITANSIAHMNAHMDANSRIANENSKVANENSKIANENSKIATSINEYSTSMNANSTSTAVETVVTDNVKS